MTDKTEGPEAGAEASGVGVDPAAMALALGGASREEANAFLKDQRGLIADQRHHLREQLKQLRLGVLGQRLSIALKGLTAVIGLALIVALGVVIWNAAHADGLVVEALAVPARFIEAGIGGEIIADDLLNKISAIRDIGVANSLDESKGVSRDRDEDIKVEIPDTGVSLGQAWHYLRLWLGHERRVTGNLRVPGDGTIALTIALEGEPAFTLGGKESDLDRLEQQAAEHVFDQVDPLNYSLFLLFGGEGRVAEALAATERVAQARAAGLAAGPTTNQPIARARYFSDTARGDGQAAVADARAYAATVRVYPVESSKLTALEAETKAMPLLAEALAQTGNFDAAQTAIDATPLDCYGCLRQRGRIAALRKNWPVASGWFARAVAAAPSVPFRPLHWFWLGRPKCGCMTLAFSGFLKFRH